MNQNCANSIDTLSFPIRPHRIHQSGNVVRSVIYVSLCVSVCLSVCLSVCVFVTTVSSAKTMLQIEMPFDGQTRVGRRNNYGGCTLAPPGEYDISIGAASAMPPITTITVATC